MNERQLFWRKFEAVLKKVVSKLQAEGKIPATLDVHNDKK